MTSRHEDFVVRSFQKEVHMMDEKRKGEIALLILKRKFAKDGIRLDENFRRNLGNEAKAINVTLEELLEFSELFVRDLVDQLFCPMPTPPPIEEVGK